MALMLGVPHYTLFHTTYSSIPLLHRAGRARGLAAHEDRAAGASGRLPRLIRQQGVEVWGIERRGLQKGRRAEGADRWLRRRKPGGELRALCRQMVTVLRQC
eukprot:366148-Chlamydomonas_euryale.AAC.5